MHTLLVLSFYFSCTIFKGKLSPASTNLAIVPINHAQVNLQLEPAEVRVVQISSLTLHSLPIFCSSLSLQKPSQNEMADYSIGDRVEVRWQAKSFAAKVIHVHSPGKVDVVYDIDGSVGIFLTVKEHGLNLLGNEEKGEGRRSCALWVAVPMQHSAEVFATRTSHIVETETEKAL